MTNEEFLKSVALSGEKWKDVNKYEGIYCVSNLGRIASLGRYKSAKNNGFAWIEPRILKEKTTRLGYKEVSLSRNGTTKRFSVHRLVALSFIPNPLGLPQIDHIDGVKSNNKVSNLRWCTAKENMQNPITKEVLKATHLGHVPIPVVAVKDGKLFKEYQSATSAQEDGYKRDSICRVCCGKRKTHRGLKWMYLSDYENSCHQ